MFSKNIKRSCLIMIISFAPFSFCSANSTFDCFYTGIGIGESFTYGKLNSSTVSSAVSGPVTSPIPLNHSLALKKSSFAAALYGGYGYAYDCLYLGGELSFKFARNNNATENNLGINDTPDGPVTVTYIENPKLNSRKFELDLDARPGYLLTDCSLFYGRIGVAFNRISYSQDINVNLFDQALQANAVPLSISQRNTKNVGLRLGLGMEQKFYENLSLRLDYVYTVYRRFTISAISDVTFQAARGTLTHTSTVRPRNQTIMLGLSYYW